MAESVKIICGCDDDCNSWVSVDSTTNKVTVKPATKSSDCGTASIVITAKDGGKQVVPVTRCLPSRNCSYAGFTVNTEIPNPIPKEGSLVTLGTYTYPTDIIDNIHIEYGGDIELSNIKKINGNITAYVKSNLSNPLRTGWFKFYVDDLDCTGGTLTQDGIKSYTRGEDCECSAYSNGKVTCSRSDTHIIVGTYSTTNCSGEMSVERVDGEDFLYDFNFSDGNIEAKVRQGSTSGERTATYKFSIDDKFSNVQFTQRKCSDGGDCSESELTYNYGYVSLGCEEKTDVNVNVPYSAYCNGVLAETGTSARTISVECNDGGPRTITVRGVEVHQGGGCTCGGGGTCSCGVVKKSGNIQYESSGNEKIEVGTYSSSNCSGSWSASHSSGKNFLSDFKFESGKIMAKVSQGESTAKDGTYSFSIGSCTKSLTFTQDGSGGGGDDCTCKISGVAPYNVSSQGAESGGTDARKVKVGEIRNLGDECSSKPSINNIEIVEGTSMVNQSDFKVDPVTGGYDVYVNILKNTTNVKRRVRVYFNCKYNGSYDYFNIYQKPGEGDVPPVTDCNPSTNSDLESYLSNFSVGTTISTGNTPCTYEVLSKVCNAAKSANRTITSGRTITWALAEMLTELTPDYNKATSYFNACVTTSYGGVPDLINGETVYNDRLKGAIAYAKLRHDEFEDINEIVVKARTELRGKGVNEATMVEVRTNPDGSFSCCRGQILNPIGLVPNNGNQTSIERITASDITAMKNILRDYPNSTSILNSSLGEDPFLDKEYCSKRYCDILGVPRSNGWLRLFDDSKDINDGILNMIKGGCTNSTICCGRTGIPAQNRLRPSGQNIDGVTADNVCCNCEESIRAECNGGTCEREFEGYVGGTNSYPSGHSGRGYISGLAYLEATGNNKMARMDEYCHNRAIVRAHWVSDTIAAKIVASTAIGFLNGICDRFGSPTFLNEIRNVRS